MAAAAAKGLQILQVIVSASLRAESEVVNQFGNRSQPKWGLKLRIIRRSGRIVDEELQRILSIGQTY
jgi:hypothetical protein